MKKKIILLTFIITTISIIFSVYVLYKQDTYITVYDSFNSSIWEHIVKIEYLHNSGNRLSFSEKEDIKTFIEILKNIKIKKAESIEPTTGGSSCSITTDNGKVFSIGFNGDYLTIDGVNYSYKMDKSTSEGFSNFFTLHN